MKKIIFGILVLMLSTAALADTRIAVVDMQKILAASPQAKAADASFKKEFTPRDEKIKAAASALQKEAQDYQRNSAVMSDAEKQAAQKKIAADRDALQSQQAQFEQDLQTTQAKMMQDIFTKIKGVIANVATKGNYDLVLQSSTVVYYKNTYDITNQVINNLK